LVLGYTAHGLNGYSERSVLLEQKVRFPGRMSLHDHVPSTSPGKHFGSSAVMEASCREVHENKAESESIKNLPERDMNAVANPLSQDVCV